MGKRLGVIDALRGIAIIGMICFHAHYMLSSLFGIDVLDAELSWYILGKAVAILFIVLAGMSLSLSLDGRSWSYIRSRIFERALILGISALSITYVTYTFFPEERISWGIIHFFMLATLLSPVALILGRYAILVGLAMMISPYIWTPEWTSLFLIPVGYPPSGYFSADYYPLIPWFGIYLMGYSFAHIFSGSYIFQTIFSLEKNRYRVLTYIGRHSLGIYMLHVPVLYGCFWILF